MMVRLMKDKLFEPGQFVAIYYGTYLMKNGVMEFVAFNQEGISVERMMIESIEPISKEISSPHIDSGVFNTFLYTGFIVKLYGSDLLAIQESLRLLPNTALKERAKELENA